MSFPVEKKSELSSIPALKVKKSDLEQTNSLKNDQVGLEDPYIKSRTTYAKLENNWKYINVSYVKRWEIKKVPNLLNCFVSINGVFIKPSSSTSTHIIYDFPILRQKWFSYMGETEYENACLAVEDACMYAQLKAIQHYHKKPKEVVKGCVFTSELEIFFVPQWKPRTKINVDKLEIQELYILSDTHDDKKE